MKLRTAPTRHAGLATIPSSLLRVGSVRRLGSPCRIATRFLARRIVVSCRRYRKTRWSETRASLRGRDVLVRNVPPTTAQRHDVAVSEFENICLSETSMGSKSSSITVSTNWVIVRDPRTGTSRHSHLGLEAPRASGEILWCWSGRSPKCIPHVVACTSKLVPRHRGRVQNTSISRDRIECGSAPVPELSLLTLLVVSLLLRPAEARQLQWCDVKNVDGSLSTRYEKVYGIVHIREPQTRRMTGHATQQHVLLECPGICQVINNMRASIPDHQLDTTIWRFTAAQHFVYFQRKLRSLGVSHQHYTLHGLRGGGVS